MPPRPREDSLDNEPHREAHARCSHGYPRDQHKAQADEAAGNVFE